MQDETSPKTPRKGPRLRLLAIVIGVALVAAGFGIWWQFIRPRTIAEVLAIEHLHPGDAIAVEGTITRVGRENTSDGPRVYLQLDGNTMCGGNASWLSNVQGDPGASYRIGDSYRTTLHFQSVAIDGDPAVWSPDLACPFPALHRSIGFVIDAASAVRELLLRYNGTDVAGWSRYEIWTRNATGFRPDALPVVLLKALPFWRGEVPIDSAKDWVEWHGVFYVMTTAAHGAQNPGFAIADRMTSLAAGTSANGTLRFVDVDSNGLVNQGDRLEVRLPPAASNAWDSYLIRMGDWSTVGPQRGFGIRLILVGSTGPFEPLGTDRLLPPTFAPKGTGS